jgi:hypothetical protein
VRGSIFILFGLLFFHASTVFGQEVVLSGGFKADSVKIGENVAYWLKIKYPQHLQAVLPDSNYNFAPFELASKQFFESKIINTEVVDSVVYILQTYEIEPTLYLKTEAIIFSKGDSLSIFSNPDSIFLKQLVSQVTDTTSLITNTEYVHVDEQINFPLLTYIVFTLAVISIIVLLVFGKRIKRHFKLKKLKKEYAQFSEYITIQIRTLKEKPTPQLAELTVAEWKKYLERLEKKPFTKLTTKEIVFDTTNKELEFPLKEIDKSVYGKIVNEELYKAFQSLEDFAQHRYAVTTEDIKHG